MSPESSIHQYKTNFKWSGWFAVGWTLLLGMIFLYLALTSQLDFVSVWKRNAFDLTTSMIAGVVASYAVPILGWKRVTLDIFKKELRLQNQFDKLTGNTRIYHLREIKEVEKKYYFWSRSKILLITFRDHSRLKLNTNFLINGYELDQTLMDLNGDKMSIKNL